MLDKRNQIIDYKGNDESFKKYNEELEKSFDYEIVYFDEEKKIKKYTGQLLNDEYEGRGILYNILGEMIYNGYFKKGKYEGYGKEFNCNELIYEGFFNNNIYNGKGTLYNQKNKKYEGNFLYGKYHGIGIEYLLCGKKRRKMKYKKGKALSKSFGVLYDDDKEIYFGILKNGKPENAKDITIYDDYDFRIYKGGFKSYEYDGIGTLYFEKENKIFFDGNFKNNMFVNGILYDLEGNKIYEGEFLDNIPKEGKNLKLYELNGNLKYKGDIFDFKYNGYGELYKNKEVIYEGYFKSSLYEGKGILYEDNKIKYNGEFKENNFHGYGKLYDFMFIGRWPHEKYYYLDYEGYFNMGIFDGKGIKYYKTGEILYEGLFRNNQIFGKGIKYYKNGSKKIEGIFDTINSCEGYYYNPKNEILFKGKIIYEIPIKSDNISLYNDETYILYKGSLINGKYEGEGIEYSNCIKDMILYKGNFLNNYFVYNIKLKEIEKKQKNKINVVIISYSGYPGKTCLFMHFLHQEFVGATSKTIVDFIYYNYEYNKNKYRLLIWDTSEGERFWPVTKNYVKRANILIYLFDLSNKQSMNENFIKEKNDCLDSSKSMIYLVGNKLDLVINSDIYRNKAKDLITNKNIDKYFEISVKTGEGTQSLLKNIEIDSIILLENIKNFNKYNYRQKIKLNKFISY